MGQQTLTFDRLANGVGLNHNWLFNPAGFRTFKDGLGHAVEFCDSLGNTYTPMDRFPNEDAAIGYGVVGQEYGVFIA